MDTGHIKSFNYFDMSALSSLKANTEESKDEKLMVVAKQLESVFLELVLKSMHEANSALKSDVYDREQENFYQEMFNKQLALSLSKSGGVGIADVIYNQLKPTAPQSNIMPSQNMNVSLKTIETKPEAAPTLNVSVVEKPLLNDMPEETPTVSLNPESAEYVSTFLDKLLPHAITAAKMIGIDPKVLLAQSALETGWGKHILHNENGDSSHNLFGVKSDKRWEGDSILAQTLEYADSQAQKIKATFKSYSSYKESFLDYINLLQNKRYEKALENVHDPKTYLTELHQAGYATDPKYVDKIMAIYEKFISI
ncbi:MAG: flagellar assembly peptidoglycan hydrolase FlgJ [Candidatus Berkiella sp.]